MIRRERGYLAYRDDVDNEASCQLQKEGYTVIRGVFSKPELKTLRSEINRVYDKYSPDSRGPFPTQWHNFRYEMLNRSAACQTAIAHRGILDAIEPLLDVTWVGRELHDRALDAVISGGGRPGLVDATSFIVMRERSIDTAFTFDRDFETAGFSLVTGPD